MKTLIIAIVLSAQFSFAVGFDEEGYSKKNCEFAKKEALFLAKANCLSLGGISTEKENFSRCRKKDNNHVISVSYTCKLSQDEDVDSYDPDFQETI